MVTYVWEAGCKFERKHNCAGPQQGKLVGVAQENPRRRQKTEKKQGLSDTEFVRHHAVGSVSIVAR